MDIYINVDYTKLRQAEEFQMAAEREIQSDWNIDLWWRTITGSSKSVEPGFKHRIKRLNTNQKRRQRPTKPDRNESQRILSCNSRDVCIFALVLDGWTLINDLPSGRHSSVEETFLFCHSFLCLCHFLFLRGCQILGDSLIVLKPFGILGDAYRFVDVDPSEQGVTLRYFWRMLRILSYHGFLSSYLCQFLCSNSIIYNSCDIVWHSRIFWRETDRRGIFLSDSQRQFKWIQLVLSTLKELENMAEYLFTAVISFYRVAFTYTNRVEFNSGSIFHFG